MPMAKPARRPSVHRRVLSRNSFNIKANGDFSPHSYAEIVIRRARFAQDGGIFPAYTALDPSHSGEQSWRISGKA
jgi:hypothetical protein